MNRDWMPAMKCSALRGMLLGVLLTAAALQGCGGNRGGLSKAEVDGMYRSGLDSFDRGEYRTALRRFQLVREVDEARPGLQHHLGICYAKIGLPGLGVEALRKALKAEPKDPDIQLDLAVTLEMTRSYHEAEGIYLQMLEADPSDPRVALNLGLLYVQRMDEPEKGREQLERYLRLEPEGPDSGEIRSWLETHPAGAPPEASPPARLPGDEGKPNRK